MSGYGQFCPVSKAAELLGERWTFLIVRELLAGSHHFNDIHRGVPKMSRTLLSRRLRTLAKAGVVSRRRARDGRIHYELTQAGLELRPLVDLLGAWGHRWISGPLDRDEVDPSLLLWELRRTAKGQGLGDRKVRVRFDFTDHAHFQRNIWEILPDGRIEARNTDRDVPVDLEVRARSRDLAEVWLGRRSLVNGLEEGCIELKGDPSLMEGFQQWLGRSPFIRAGQEQ